MYSDRIKEIRTKLNISVAKLAKKLGMSASTLTSYETSSRTPSIEFCTRLYNVLDVNVNWFVSGKGEMFNAQYNAEKDNLRSEVLQILKEEGVIS